MSGHHMPRRFPTRSTRNTRVNYAESVCSAVSDNDSEYLPNDYVADVVANGSVSSDNSELRRSPRLIEKNSRKNRDGQKR
jgi:hypothetical protein